MDMIWTNLHLFNRDVILLRILSTITAAKLAGRQVQARGLNSNVAGE